MSCKYYYFYCGEYHCGKCNKDVTSDWYYKYCRNYDYDDCPVYKDNMREPPSSDSGSGCFLTSACASAKGLPDDCYELQTLRHYRDNWLACTDSGRSAISYYYIVAPQIVTAINQSANRKDIYEMIYERMVKPCVQFIEQGEYQKAFDLYKGMTLQLSEQFC